MRHTILVAALVGCGEAADGPGVRADEHRVDVVLGGRGAAGAVDYLFVVDGSSSMKSVVDRVFAGVDAIVAEGDVFPPGARIAVMGTTPHRPGDPTRPHRAVAKDAWLPADPGYGDPIDRERIEAFRRIGPPEAVERFGLDGCDAWFSPDEANAAGVPCFVAHTQTMMHPVKVEAGLTALGQRLASGPLFRDGAAVNVFFVSDTHDPGLAPDKRHYDELVALRPDFATLSALADLHHTLSSLRVHAVAPGSDCTDERWADPVYFEAAEASGGTTLDICTAEPEDFVEMMRRAVERGAVPERAVVPLDRPAERAEVAVDGRPVGSRLSRDGRAVVLDRLPSSPSDVTVTFEPRPTNPARPADGARTPVGHRGGALPDGVVAPRRNTGR